MSNENKNIAENENNDGKIAEIVEQFGLECPNNSECKNEGAIPEHDCGSDEELCRVRCPIPVQCEFCWTNPQSKHNLRLKLIELIRTDRKKLLTNIERTAETGILVTKCFEMLTPIEFELVHLRASADIKFVELKKILEILSDFAV